MTRPQRARGTGSITPHQGGFWARLPVEGKTKSLGVHPTYEAAEAVLHKALLARASTPGASAGQVTFATFGRRVLDMREEEGMRNVEGERRIFTRHLETCAFADKPIAQIESVDVADLLRALSKKSSADDREPRKIKRTTVQRHRAVLSAIFKVAVERGLRSSNPCTGVRVKGTKPSTVIDPDADEDWDWLRGDEQQAFLACADIEPWFRAMVRVAWGTGLRQGEQWNLELKDVHLPTPKGCACGALKCIRLQERGAHLHVRYAKKGHLPPKNGLTRVTPLFGEGLAGMREWLAILPTYASVNPLRLAFPSQTGCRRQVSAPRRKLPRDANGKQTVVFLLDEALAKVGITRHIRWHDLRHTCASSLISGTWGRAWDLVKVRDMLGHRDIATTQRYAHLASNVLRDEGMHTPGHEDVIQSVMPTSAGATQTPVSAAENAPSGPPAPDASFGGVGSESKHEVRSIPNTSIAREAAYELLRLFGPDALKLALKLTSEAPGADPNEKDD